MHRYEVLNSNRYVVFPYKFVNAKAILYEEDEISTLFPEGYKYLKACESELRGREKGRFDNDKWFQFGRNQGIGYGNIPKLVAPEISLGGNYSFDFDGHYYSTTTVYGYIKRNSFSESYYTWMAILNSKLCWWFMIQTGTVLANGYYRYKPAYLKPFPIPVIPKEYDTLLCNLAKRIIQENNSEIRATITKEINKLVFALYNLNDDEIRIVESC